MANFFDTIPATQGRNFFDDIPSGADVPSFDKGDLRDNEATATIYNFASAVPFAQKAAAAIGAPIKSMMSGGGLEGVAPAYNELRDRQKQIDQIYDRDRNNAANVGAIGGAVVNPANWALGGAGLVANAGLQAGSDTDFSKEGAGGEFAGKAATNLVLGKLLQKSVGAITGNNTVQSAGNYIAKRLSSGDLDGAAAQASKLAKIGGADAPLALTAGQNAVGIAIPALKSDKIADKVEGAVENVKNFIGRTSKADMDTKLKGGSMKDAAAAMYEQPKKVQATGDYWDNNMPDIAKPYIQQAQDKFPGVVEKFGPKSGAIVKEAMKLAGKSGSVDNAIEVKKALQKFSGGIFDEADNAYATVSGVRRQSQPLLAAAKQGAAAAERKALNNETTPLLTKILRAPLKGIGSTIGTLTNKTVNRGADPKVQAKIVDLLLNQSTNKASKTINLSRSADSLLGDTKLGRAKLGKEINLDNLLQTNNKNALTGKNKIMDKFGGITPEQYLPYLAMHLRRKQ